MNLFDRVGGRFFTPLDSKNKIIYWDCLKIIHNLVSSESSYGIERDAVINVLVDYFSKQEDDEMLLEEE